MANLSEALGKHGARLSVGQAELIGKLARFLPRTDVEILVDDKGSAAVWCPFESDDYQITLYIDRDLKVGYYCGKMLTAYRRGVDYAGACQEIIAFFGDKKGIVSEGG